MDNGNNGNNGNRGNNGKGKKILEFLGENWYLITSGLLVLIMIISFLILAFDKPKNKSKNTANCYSNENYITDVIVTNNVKCPDGYIDSHKNSDTDKFIKINETDENLKLCYQKSNQICDVNTVFTNLNLNFNIKPQDTCSGTESYPGCENSNTVTCELSDKISLSLKQNECRCNNCGDLPVGYYDKDQNRVSNCSGIVGTNGNNILCSAQQSYIPNVSGVTDITTTNTKKGVCPDKYTLVENTNICYFK